MICIFLGNKIILNYIKKYMFQNRKYFKKKKQMNESYS